MILNPEIECLSLEEQRKIQLQLIKKALTLAYKKSKFYRKKFNELNINPKDFTSLEDIKKISITTKEDFIKNWNDFLTEPLENYVRMYESGGTTGNPKIIVLTENDHKFGTKIMGRNLASCDISEKDAICSLINLGTNIATFYVLDALVSNRIMSIPLPQSTHPERIISFIKKLKPTILMTTAPALLELTKKIEEIIDPKELGIHTILSGATHIPKNLRKFLEEKWGAEWFHAYGTSEAGRMSFECSEHNGYHVNIDNIFFEVLDPKTKRVVKEGEEGEIVITLLNREGLPLIRYDGLHDLVKYTNKKCKCGRTTPRVWVIGRLEHSITLKGFYKLYLYQIEEVLTKYGLFDYRLIVEEKGKKDHITLYIEGEERGKLKDEIKKNILTVCDRLGRGIEDGYIIEPKIVFVKKNSLPRTEIGKIKDKLVDKRRYKFF